MGVMVRERAQECALMEQRRDGDVASFCHGLQLLPEPQLPSGWEKCLDLKSGLIYFKDWNSGTVTYRDPRRSGSVMITAQRIGLLSISLSPDDDVVTTMNSSSPSCNHGDDVGHASTETSLNSVDEHCLELTLNLPGTITSSISSRPPGRPAVPTTSVCTVEKVRSALERSQWTWSRPQAQIITLPQKPRAGAASPSRDQSLEPLESSSPSTSQCSSDYCTFTSTSVTMSDQGDEELLEVQQPHECRDVAGAKSCQEVNLFAKKLTNDNINQHRQIMVTVGCTRCLMFVMLSKSHPNCPRCGNADVLLELPAAAPLPKRQRVLESH